MFGVILIQFSSLCTRRDMMMVFVMVGLHGHHNALTSLQFNGDSCCGIQCTESELHMWYDCNLCGFCVFLCCRTCLWFVPMTTDQEEDDMKMNAVFRSNDDNNSSSKNSTDLRNVTDETRHYAFKFTKHISRMVSLEADKSSCNSV